MSFAPAVFATLQLGAGIFEAISQTQEAEIKAVDQEFAAGAELFNADIARQEARLRPSETRCCCLRRLRPP